MPGIEAIMTNFSECMTDKCQVGDFDCYERGAYRCWTLLLTHAARLQRP